MFSFSTHEQHFHFSTFHSFIFQSKMKEWKDPFPHNLQTAFYPVLFSTLTLLHPRSFWRTRISRVCQGEKVWTIPLPCLNNPLHSEWCQLQEERVHCLSLISYVALNKWKLIWPREQIVWRSDSIKCQSIWLACKEHKSVTIDE